jgi:hypothetical protein
MLIISRCPVLDWGQACLTNLQYSNHGGHDVSGYEGSRLGVRRVIEYSSRINSMVQVKTLRFETLEQGRLSL